jgi:hypothetical protein
MKNKKIKIRKTWNISPVTKVKKSKKIYNRALTNQQIKNILNSEDL